MTSNKPASEQQASNLSRLSVFDTQYVQTDKFVNSRWGR